MAVEFIEILKVKEALKKTTKKELTEQSVKDSTFSYTLNVLRGVPVGTGKSKKTADIKQVLVQDPANSKVWYLTLKYGVVPVSSAKITANTKDEAVGDAIKYVEGLKTKLNDAVAGQFKAAFNSKKKSLADAEKTRTEKKKKAA